MSTSPEIQIDADPTARGASETVHNVPILGMKAPKYFSKGGA